MPKFVAVDPESLNASWMSSTRTSVASLPGGSPEPAAPSQAQPSSSPAPTEAAAPAATPTAAPAASPTPEPEPKPADVVPPAKVESDTPPSDHGEHDVYDGVDWNKADPRRPSDWKKFKENRSKQVSDLNKQLSEARKAAEEAKAAMESAKAVPQPTEAPPEAQERIKALEAENQKLHEAFVRTDIKADPKFRDYFDKKYAAATEKAKGAVGPDLAPRLETALKIQDPTQRNAAIEELLGEVTSPLAQNRLVSAIDLLDSIASEEQSEIATAETLRQKRAAEKATQSTATQKQIEATWNKTLEGLRKEYGPLNPTHGEAAKKREAAAQRLLLGTGVQPEEAIRAAIHAACHDDIVAAAKAEIGKYQEQVKSLEKQISDLRGAQPSAGISPAPAGGGPKPGVPQIKRGMAPYQVDSAFFEATRAAMANR